MIFPYDFKKFNQIHIIRTAIVLAIYLFVFIFNYFRLEEAHRSGYLRLFLPLTLILLFFLYRNYKKQIKVIRESFVELKGNLLSQVAWNGSTLDIDVKKITSLKKDKYRLYNRVLLEDNEKIYSLINLLEPEKLIQEVEKISGLSCQIVTESNSGKLQKIFYSFIPSLVICLFWIAGQTTWQTAALLVNANLVIWLLYQEKTSLYRKLLFVSMILFAYQIYSNLIR